MTRARSGATSVWHRTAPRLRRLAALTIALPVLLLVPSTASAQPGLEAPTGDPVVVSLGDSYISGTGGRWAGNSDSFLFDLNGTDRAYRDVPGQFWGDADPATIYGDTAKSGCYRSDSAPIRSAVEVAGLDLGRPVNLACSGARAVNVLRQSAGGTGFRGEQPQNDQLAALARTSRVALVVLSIGGNDLSFPDLVVSCISAYVRFDDPCKSKQQPLLDASLPKMGQAVGAALDDVRATLADAGYADGDYRLILQSYPNPLPSATEDKYAGAWRAFKWTGGRCPFTDPDMTWTAKTVMPSITNTLRGTAQSHGASFLDLSNAFDGHEVCADGTGHPWNGPTAEDVEWVRFVDYAKQGAYAESMHPNYFGQQAVGTCIARAARQEGDSVCTSTPGEGLEGLRLTAP